MVSRPHDPRQGSLLDWEPPAIVVRFDDRRVFAPSLRGMVSRAVAAVLNDTEISRDDLATSMSEIMKEPFSRNMLDKYASQAAEEQTIPAHRLIALMMATGDVRPLQMQAEPLDHAVIKKRYLGAVEAEIASDRIEELESFRKQARRRWKGGWP